jgi:hypothetical protein
MLGFRSIASRGVFLAAGVVLVACGGGSSNGGGAPAVDGGVDGGAGVDAGGGDAAANGDASTGLLDGSTGDASTMDSSTDAAVGPMAAAPQVVNLGGTVLTAPKVQLIVYAEDPLATDADNMVTELTQTTTWHEQTAEYGVGPLTKLPTIQIAGTPPATLDDDGNGTTPFEQTLINNTTGGSPAWGTADSSTIYAFVLPSGTNITSGGNCCTDFYGYHYEAPISSTMSIPYAIICNCTSPQGDPLTPLQNVTTTISHELAESATDPFSDTSPAYAESDDADFIWTVATGGEVADMCEYNADSNYTPPGSTYMVQRSWSNAAATAGTNPCVPVPMPALYFESVPVLPDAITLDYYGQTVQSQGVSIPIGSSKTIDVRLSSTAPTSGPWTVTAYDLNYYLTGDTTTANTVLTLDTTSGSNGDVLHLTIRVNSAYPHLGGEGFVLVSDLGTQENISMGAIGN